ncbi:MAG: anaerobic sulfatase maturase [Gemmatimonadales bacterium]|nr:anaerobic sulfatase maturase [Gemmatimonadales bacterium]
MTGRPPLTLLIKPAGADCNLRCNYCFYLKKGALYPEPGPHRMTDGVLESLTRNYLELDLPVHSFCWQGGEPALMGLPFFQKAVDLQKQYGRSGRTMANSLQTNCTLLDEHLASHFAQYRFLVGCSIDGPAELHDQFRRTPGGRGSHSQVLRGIEILHRHKVAVNAMTLVSAANVHQPAEIFDYLLAHEFDFLQFIPCVEFTDEGRPQPYSITASQWGDFLCGIFDRWWPQGPGRISIRLFDALMARLALGQEGICTFGRDCRQYLVIEHNGDVYPCDFFVEPNRKLGNVLTESLADIQHGPTFREFGALKTPSARPCLECRYLDLCQGDCPAHRSPAGYPAGTGSWLCEGWAQFFDHALPRLEELACREMARRGMPPP